MLIGRVLRALGIGLAASVLLPAAASASTVSVVDHVLYYTADPGETNNLSVTYPNGVYTLSDPGASNMTAVAPDCSPAGANKVTCGQILSLTGVSIDLGDGNDTESSQALIVTPVTVHGGTGNDTISTGAAADYLDGGPGNDTLDAGFGHDTLDGGMGADVLRGGAGFDTVTYGDRVAPVSASVDGQAGDGEAGEGDNVATDVEGLVGGSAADTLTGSAGTNTLLGGAGNDNLSGLGGDDTIEGGAGSDQLDGGAGADTLKARDGEADGIVCGSEADSVQSDESDAVAADCESVDSSGAIPPPTPTGGGPVNGAGGPLPVLPSPAVLIATARAILAANGSLVIKLACPKEVFEGCTGTITIEVNIRGADRRKLSKAARRNLVKLATRRFKIAAGQTRAVAVPLSRLGKRFFATHRSADVTVTVAIKTATGITTTTRKIKVKARSYRHAPGAKGRHR